MKKIILPLVIILLVIGGIYWVSVYYAGEDSQNLTNEMPVVNSGENPEEGGIHNLPVEPAAAIARKDLAVKLSVDEKSIVIMQITPMEWNDGCLGLGKANESCLQALVPGFKVELLAKGKTYIYRTDKTGTSIRAESL